MATQVPQQGWGQMTPAQSTIIRSGLAGATRLLGRSSTSRKRRKYSSAARGRKRSASSGSRKKKSGASRLIKGSAAAKRYMAKLRAKRK